MKINLLLILLLASCLNSFSQNSQNLAEKLGFDSNAKLLIVHADDLGLSHATNSAVIEAFQKGGINSGSIMVPCPWFPEIAEFSKNNPQFDIGIHTTFTSEWDKYFFGGILPASCIPGLLNKNGYFYPSVEAFAQHAIATEVEKEARAQIERALSFGIKPTHLDNHMGTVMTSPEYYQILLNLGKEYRLPVLIPADMIAGISPQFLEMLSKDNIVVNHLFMIYQASPAEKWGEPYLKFIADMKPGLNEIIVHLAYDNDETRAIMVNHPDFGSEWRQHDLDFVLSEDFKKALKDHDIKLVTWRQIGEVQYPEK
ncbi:MAG: polysaccharide deacetylase family protein [Bacteroidota bacterium]|nr:polysaccharide deacetylase family protein [Bacteroidota bacterium]